MWGLKNYAALIGKISANDNIRIYIIGGKDDAQYAGSFTWSDKVLNCIGRFPFGLTVEIMRQSRVFIGNDSGPQYFAAYSGLKTCVIYGNTVNFKRWQPKVKAENFIAISKPTGCGPCELAECNQNKHVCMNIITVDEVYKAVEKWL
jgi:heptosyltransferase-3